MNTLEISTPRTAKAELEFGIKPLRYNEEMVMSIFDFARTLERELSAKTTECDGLVAQVKVLSDALPKIDKQGVRFGKNTWISFDRLTGYEGDPDNQTARTAHYLRIIPSGFVEWGNQCHAALTQTQGDK